MQSLKRILKRNFSRKALPKRNLPYLLWRYIDNADRTLKAKSASNNFPDAGRIAREITDRGIVVGASDQFLSDEGREALVEASRPVLNIGQGSESQAIITGGASSYKKSYLINLVEREKTHSPDSPLLRVALDNKLLEIVPNLLGMWHRLHSISAPLNFPTDAEPRDSQLWHRDPEDIQMVKAFIYLIDVDEDNGPFKLHSPHPLFQHGRRQSTDSQE